MELQRASTVAELCQVLTKTNKSSIYPLIARIICLMLTLLVSTATTDRTFSAMKIVKTRLRNNFLSSYLVAYIKKEIAREFSTHSIIDEFSPIKKRMVQFRMPSIEK
ncbi:hypothetical protein J1N35_029306 [Gossypium stocksii]|uniref:HAT C-terminal dimerisation domain-containing protein n=1 Tax=Gossypium stocksii TaxID=47602 RepID=A0A9D3UYH5_9ROSI|nr:hypothetical protein J1N35_029306 [Gossypium stocksii]